MSRLTAPRYSSVREHWALCQNLYTLKYRLYFVTAPCYSRVEEHCIHGKTKRIWKVIRTEMGMTKIHIQRIWKVICTDCEWRKPLYIEMIVIRKEMYMTKIHSKRNGSHSYRNVHDENPLKKEWIVIRTEMCMTTISFCMDFRHARFCTNDYPFFLNGFSSCTNAGTR